MPRSWMRSIRFGDPRQFSGLTAMLAQQQRIGKTLTCCTRFIWKRYRMHITVNSMRFMPFTKPTLEKIRRHYLT